MCLNLYLVLLHSFRYFIDFGYIIFLTRLAETKSQKFQMVGQIQVHNLYWSRLSYRAKRDSLTGGSRVASQKIGKKLICT